MAHVLVTGGSGFIAGHAIQQLVAAGHRVRTTVRNLSREPQVRTTLAITGDQLAFAAADLEKDDGWADACKDIDYALHVASPFPMNVPKDENDLIRPARDGALRLLRAARDRGVKRVVLTSSFAAVGYGHPEQTEAFDEKTWTNVDGPGVSAYVKSKTIAERAAWDFVKAEGGSLELATVNPVGVFGPVLGADLSTSVVIVQRMLAGSVPGCPKMTFGVVDVRDVADLHLRAMTAPEAKGERFLAVAGPFMPLSGIAKLLKSELGEQAKKVKTMELPNFMVRFASLFDGSLKQVIPELGKTKQASHDKATRLLGWKPRSNEESVLASARSLLEKGLATKAATKAA